MKSACEKLGALPLVVNSENITCNLNICTCGKWVMTVGKFPPPLYCLDSVNLAWKPFWLPHTLIHPHPGITWNSSSTNKGMKCLRASRGTSDAHREESMEEKRTEKTNLTNQTIWHKLNYGKTIVDFYK